MAPSGGTAADGRLGTVIGMTGGVAAVVAGACWTVKAAAILATGNQPALLFELAPSLMAVAVLVLAQQLPRGGPRLACTGMAAAALVAGVVVLVPHVTPVPSVAYGVAMAGATLLVLVVLVTAGVSLRRRLEASLPLVLGLVTVPGVLLGGLAAEVLGERALEVPLVVLGGAWVVLGVQLARGRYRTVDVVAARSERGEAVHRHV